MDKLVINALAGFGINEVESISRIKCCTKEKNMWIIDDKYILKTYADLKSLERIVLLNDELYQAGAQVPRYYRTKAGELYVKADEDVYYTLADKIHGSNVDMYEGNYKKRAFAIGKGIAKFHLALKELRNKTELWNGDCMAEFHDWILREIKEKNIPIKQDVINYLISFEELYRKLPRQIIHRDLHGGNMLIDNDELAAIIDISDITQVNVRIFDLCYYVSFFPDSKNDEEIEKWFIVFKSLLSGYNTVSEFTDDEFKAIPYMCAFIELLWIAFDEMIKGYADYLPNNGFWTYDNRDKLLFSKQDIMQD